jgi:hypothetical protein
MFQSLFLEGASTFTASAFSTTTAPLQMREISLLNERKVVLFIGINQIPHYRGGLIKLGAVILLFARYWLFN